MPCCTWPPRMPAPTRCSGAQRGSAKSAGRLPGHNRQVSMHDRMACTHSRQPARLDPAAELAVIGWGAQFLTQPPSCCPSPTRQTSPSCPAPPPQTSPCRPSPPPQTSPIDVLHPLRPSTSQTATASAGGTCGPPSPPGSAWTPRRRCTSRWRRWGGAPCCRLGSECVQAGSASFKQLVCKALGWKTHGHTRLQCQHARFSSLTAPLAR